MFFCTASVVLARRKTIPRHVITPTTDAGLTLAAHGVQKLFAWFGGPGLDATGQFFETIGFLPGPQCADGWERLYFRCEVSPGPMNPSASGKP
jgi:hypothetical protein